MSGGPEDDIFSKAYDAERAATRRRYNDIYEDAKSQAAVRRAPLDAMQDLRQIIADANDVKDSGAKQTAREMRLDAKIFEHTAKRQLSVLNRLRDGQQDSEN